MVTAAARNIRFGFRGPGGEISDTFIRCFMAMRRERFDAAMGVMGGKITAIGRKSDGALSLAGLVRADRLYYKLRGLGTLEKNTASSYGYAPLIMDVVQDEGNPAMLTVVGTDGRALNIEYHFVDETNRNLKELLDLDLLLDATGVGLKDKDIKKHPDQDPNLYMSYPNLTVLFTAPAKTVKGIPHHLAGLHEAVPGQLNATGSCTTHAGVDLIRAIREELMKQLGLASEELIIEGGMLDTTHALTPTDINFLRYAEGAYVAQTTGFGSAAKKVYASAAGIGNLDAATGRYNSFYGNIASGASMLSLSMTFSVKKGKEPVTQGMIETAIRDMAQDPEGRKHIGIISDKFVIDENKKIGVMTTLSLAGMTKTIMLPLGDNIKVVKIGGTMLKDGVEYDVYVVTVKNAVYDNRLGFTVDLLEELNSIALARLGTELIPGFNHQDDIGTKLAFALSKPGQELFAKALELTGGNLVLPY